MNKFRNAALLPHSFGHPSRPAPALLSAVYLWGVHLSQSQALLQQEQSFVLRALHHVVTDAFRSHPNVILHTLQAEVLMSYYFIRTGRFIEAKSHTATAVSLALGAGMHKIRSVHPIAPSILGVSSDISVSLPALRGSIEETEQVNGFWAVVVLHKCITITLEPPMSICGTLEAPGTQVDTPWPLDVICYPQSLHRLIENFRNILLPYADIEHPLARTILFTHALANGAAIKLHDHFSCIQSSSQQHCLEAAQRIVSFGDYDIQEVGLVNPFMGTLLVVACDVFIKAISRLRSSGNAWAVNSEWSEDELLRLLGSGITILRARSDESAFTKYQLTQIQEAFSAIEKTLTSF
ncbi:hypothetical protein C0993_010194 [Termitomyces sp. T159_Od127]|nr:hypothetical protein C0993_010194 [Termitomyces sp. T159_Od127]